MSRQADGSFRLFQVAGIDVFIHWSWLLVAFVQIRLTENRYENPIFNAIEYVSLFGIVLLHEFGHAFACRSVGGLANRILLWPLGGVAIVSPPPRPGALLWSIAAGPLVNVLLVPVTVPLLFLTGGMSPDIQHFALTLAAINLGLLIFNMLPIYPLDGGQILQALLWFQLGRSRSLFVASILGLIIGAGLIVPLLLMQNWWTALIAAFIALRSWAGIKQARFLQQLETLRRHTDLACPFCHAPPVQGESYRCPECGALYDVFDWKGICPRCQSRAAEVMCLNCFRPQPLAGWYPPSQAPALPDNA
jgi:Zn-dependent protease